MTDSPPWIVWKPGPCGAPDPDEPIRSFQHYRDAERFAAKRGYVNRRLESIEVGDVVDADWIIARTIRGSVGGKDD